MRIKDITENSPDTPKGSISNDLNQSKSWLCHCLNQLNLSQFDYIYVLGCWYGSINFFLIKNNINFDHIINVDIDPKKVKFVNQLITKNNWSDRIHAICQDVNNLKYQGNKILVINTSTNDIDGTDWLTNIPKNSVVALQGRDNQIDSNGIETIEKFDQSYPLQKTLALKTKQLLSVDDEPYHRFLKIGII